MLNISRLYICSYIFTSATSWFVKIWNLNGNTWHSSCSACPHFIIGTYYCKIVSSHLVTILGATAFRCYRTAPCMNQILILAQGLLAPLWCDLQVWTAEPTAQVSVFSCELLAPVQPTPMSIHPVSKQGGYAYKQLSVRGLVKALAMLGLPTHDVVFILIKSSWKPLEPHICHGFCDNVRDLTCSTNVCQAAMRWNHIYAHHDGWW